ncbi:MAG: hypothetical protein H6513_05850 [Acidimicrobiaceae bacterium]|nr:hypothetical protein [Ilumatobacter sp.]MCB9380199.1 hypothetical protein [Acidimicrobiaceae bacterium]MCO5329345.1 hypothetical protein [Ilumatobacteraceae bacterium]
MTRLVSDLPPAIDARLHDGEIVEWSGRPRQGVFLRPIDALLVPLMLVWASLPTVGFVVSIRKGTWNPGLLFLLLFVVVGQYFLWGRLLVDAAVRKGVFYAVTDQRCLIVGTRLRRATRSYPRGRGEYELVEHRNGRGTVRFSPSGYFSGRRNPWGEWFSLFDQIHDAPEVYRLVCRAPQRDGNQRPAPTPRRHPGAYAKEPGRQPGPFDQDR